MSEFSIQMGNMRGEVDSLSDIVSRLNKSREDVNRIISTITISGEAGLMIRKSLKDAVDNLDDMKQRSDNMKSGLSNIINRYETAENTIIGTETKSQRAIEVKGSKTKLQKKGSMYNKAAGVSILDDGEGGKEASAFAKTSLGEGSISVSSPYGTISGSGKFLSAETFAGVKTHFGNGDYSASMKAGVSASLAEGNISVDTKYASVSASGMLFAAMGGTEAVASFKFKNGKASADLRVSAGVEAVVARVKTESTFGTDKYNIHNELEGSALGAGAKSEAGISIKNDGTFSIKGGAGAEAYLVKGKVKGGFSFLGVKFNCSGEAMVGVEAKVGGEIKSTGAAGKVGIGPIGGTFSIDWSDFDLLSFRHEPREYSPIYEQARPWMRSDSTFSGRPTGALFHA